MTTISWTTSSLARRDRFYAWASALNESHLDFSLSTPGSHDFKARIRQRSLSGIQLVDCHCDPCAGHRGSAQISKGGQAYFGVLFLMSGKEIVRDGSHEFLMLPRDMLLWDSTRHIDFNVVEPLHKLTLLIPQDTLDAALPRARDYVGTAVRGAAGSLVASYLQTLVTEFSNIEEDNGPAIMDMTVDMLASALRMNLSRGPSLVSGVQLKRILDFIEKRLRDPELTPARIAASHGISVRYLHMLFAGHDLTVAKWVRHRRLMRSSQDLKVMKDRSTLTEVAMRWGFSDSAQFSRVFKLQFGVAPSAYRRSYQ